MVELEFPASATYVGLARLIIAGLGRQGTADEDTIYDLKLAISEIASTLVDLKNLEKINVCANRENEDLFVTFKGINNLDMENILESRLINKDKLGLLVDNVSIIKDDNAIGITLSKRLNT